MDGGGSPPARLAAALALSLSAHLVLAWGLGALLGSPEGVAAAGAGNLPHAVAARLQGVEQVAQAPAKDAGARLPTRRGTGTAPGGARYLPASELDARPQIMTRVNPEYPPELVAGIRGRVVLELYIAPDGTLDEVRVARAEPPGRFEASALKAFGGARFTPGMKKGKPVPSLVRIELTYGD